MSIWIPSGLKDGGGSSYVPPEWSSGTDEEIVEALEKHYAGEVNLQDYWSIGDERVISLSAMSASDNLPDTHSAQDVTFVITEQGGKYLADGITECAFQVDQKNILSDTQVKLDHENVTFGWVYFYSDYTGAITIIDSIDRRTWLNNTYYNAIPSSIRPIFKKFQYKSLYNYSGTTYNVSDDYFTLRAYSELHGALNNSGYIYDEGDQVTYYKTSANKRKSYSYGYYTRTCNKYQDASAFWRTNPDGSNYGTSQCQYLNAGIAPFGVI